MIDSFRASVLSTALGERTGSREGSFLPLLGHFLPSFRTLFSLYRVLNKEVIHIPPVADQMHPCYRRKSCASLATLCILGTLTGDYLASFSGDK